MTSHWRSLSLLGCIALAASARAAAPPIGDRASSDGAALVRAGEHDRTFRPRFMLLFTPDDPELEFRRADIERISYTVPSWRIDDNAADGVRNDDVEVHAGDGLDPKILGGRTAGRTADYFRAARGETLTAQRTSAREDGLLWEFAAHPLVDLRARVEFAQDAPPRLKARYTAKRAGWYSLGYVGAPGVAPAEVEELWQPLIWNERRFPRRAFATPAYHCPIPTALVQADGATVGVVMSPDEIPFEPLPTRDNSRFAVLARSADGQAQPQVFFPLLGGVGSRLEVGDEVAFEAQLFVHDGDLPSAYERVGRDICGFADRRQNLDISLNETIRNMTAYGLSEYSLFNDELRGCSYATDVPDAVKNVSAMHPLSLALIFDDRRIYDDRALPILEYLLSREKLLFARDPNVKTQSPSSRMRGPCANVSELALLHAISGGRDYAMLHYAEALFSVERTLNLKVAQPGDTWQAALALFEATGEQCYREHFRRRVAKYLRERVDVLQSDFNDPYAGELFFWTAFLPRWTDLYMLYERTGAAEHLAAALAGARRYAMFTWLIPQPPAGDVLINEGGVAPHYWYLKSKGHAQMHAPERRLPAWQVSELGLTPESSGTAHGHRGIFPATYAPWMLRIAKQTGDELIRDVARSAMVGRYRNFPGYHMNTGRTDVYMAADYPLRPHQELGYNSFHYNHVWPMIALLVDYLVADAFLVSDGAIDFPSRYVEGYAYFQGKVYGDRPGRFYDRAQAWLWMPEGLLAVDHPQLNYLTARTEDGELLVALVNQSREPVQATVRLGAHLAFDRDQELTAQLWRQNKPAGATTLRDGAVRVDVAPRGIVALAIKGAAPQTRFQPQMLEDRGRPLSAASHRRLEFGDTRAMLLSFSRALTSAYVYCREDQSQIRRARLEYRLLGADASPTRLEDAAYPFEFSAPFPASADGLEFVLEIERPDGRVERSEPTALLP